MHLYCLRILLSIPLDCNMISCLFQLNFVFFLRAYIFLTCYSKLFVFSPDKRTQNWFKTNRQIFYTFIYTYLLLFIYTYLFRLMFSLYYYVNLIKLLNMGNIETTMKFSRLKSISSEVLKRTVPLL